MRGLCLSPPLPTPPKWTFENIWRPIDFSQMRDKCEVDTIISWTEVRDAAIHGTRQSVTPIERIIQHEMLIVPRLRNSENDN